MVNAQRKQGPGRGEHDAHRNNSAYDKYKDCGFEVSGDARSCVTAVRTLCGIRPPGGIIEVIIDFHHGAALFKVRRAFTESVFFHGVTIVYEGVAAFF
jgi:hypothetical protein